MQFIKHWVLIKLNATLSAITGSSWVTVSPAQTFHYFTGTKKQVTAETNSANVSASTVGLFR